MQGIFTWIAALLGTVALTMSVSAYDNSQGVPPYKGLTRSGITARPGVAACGPALYGKTLYSMGFPERFVTCLDTGSAVTNNHVDIWMETNEEAWQWGRKTLLVVVLPVPTPQVMMTQSR